MKVDELFFTGKGLRGIFENAASLDRVRELLEKKEIIPENMNETFTVGEKTVKGYLSIDAIKLDESGLLCTSVSILNVSEA